MKFRLKDFRQSKNLFQSDMAELLGTNQSTVSRMELRKSAELSLPQYESLCNKFGKEEVDKFVFTDESVSVSVTGNSNHGSGTQSNNVSFNDSDTMAAIKALSGALSELARKQAEQTDRLLSILEKMTGGEQ